MQTAVAAVAAGGKVVHVGLGHHQCTLNTDHLVSKELDVLGSFRFTNTVRLADSGTSSQAGGRLLLQTLWCSCMQCAMCNV